MPETGIDDQTMPEPGVLPFADSVSTPPDEPHGERIELCETGGRSKSVPLNLYALNVLHSSDQMYIQARARHRDSSTPDRP